jgi:hypothetical protein
MVALSKNKLNMDRLLVSADLRHTIAITIPAVFNLRTLYPNAL